MTLTQDQFTALAADIAASEFSALPQTSDNAYEIAVARGTDVDQPRNLAKSVTVE